MISMIAMISVVLNFFAPARSSQIRFRANDKDFPELPSITVEKIYANDN